MLQHADVIGFIPCHSLEQAERFYSRTLGLPVQSNDGFALVLGAAGDVTVRCVLTSSFTPQPFTIFGWNVPDLDAMAAVLFESGIPPRRYPHLEQDEQGIWTAPNGNRVLWFTDPFDNLLSVSQHAAQQSARVPCA